MLCLSTRIFVHESNSCAQINEGKKKRKGIGFIVWFCWCDWKFLYDCAHLTQVKFEPPRKEKTRLALVPGLVLVRSWSHWSQQRPPISDFFFPLLFPDFFRQPSLTFPPTPFHLRGHDLVNNVLPPSTHPSPPTRNYPFSSLSRVSPIKARLLRR